MFECTHRWRPSLASFEGNVSCPTLFIHGEKDSLVPPSHSVDPSVNTSEQAQKEPMPLRIRTETIRAPRRTRDSSRASRRPSLSMLRSLGETWRHLGAAVHFHPVLAPCICQAKAERVAESGTPPLDCRLYRPPVEAQMPDPSIFFSMSTVRAPEVALFKQCRSRKLLITPPGTRTKMLFRYLATS